MQLSVIFTSIVTMFFASQALAVPEIAVRNMNQLENRVSFPELT